MKYTQKLDLNLHFLWLSLQSLTTVRYDKKVEKKLKDLILYVENILFDDVYCDYDIVDTECLYTVYLKKLNEK